MTVDEARAELKQDLGDVADKLDGLSAQVAAIATDVAALSATTGASSGRHATEIEALFKRRDDHERRIATIEKEYVPRTEHAEHGKRLNMLETGSAKSSGIVWAITFLIQIIGMGGIAALIKFGGGH